MIFKKAHNKLSTDPETPSSSQPVLGDVGVYTMFSGITRQLVEWCNFHINAGAKALYIVLDRPTDKQIKQLPKHKAITYIVNDERTLATIYPGDSPNVERKQTDGFFRAAELAEKHGCRFLAFVDCDELIALNKPLSKIADDLPNMDVLRLRPREMWRSQKDPVDEPFGASLSLDYEPDKDVNWHDILGWRTVFTRNGFLGHTVGKSIYRLPFKGPQITVHGPKLEESTDTESWVDPKIASILHFDSGDFVSWQQKWLHRHSGKSRAIGQSNRRMMQFSLMGDVLSRNLDFQKDFFKSFFCHADTEVAKLRALGLIKEIDISDSLKGPLKVPQTKESPQETKALVGADKVDFQFGLVTDDNFAAPTFATALSVVHQLQKKGSIRFIILGDGLSQKSIHKLFELERAGDNIQVNFHDITEDLDRDVGKGDPKRATFGRVYFSDYLPPQRTIYLDSDVLATRDFSELFDLDMGKACLAGVSDSAALRCKYYPESVSNAQRMRLEAITKTEESVEYYLNGGVLVMALENFEFRQAASELRYIIETLGSRLTQRDQDAVNTVFTGKKMLLDAKYNYMTQFFTAGFSSADGIRERKYAFADAALIHFSGKTKPWKEAVNEFYNELYRRMVIEVETALGISCDFYFSSIASQRTKRTLPDEDLVQNAAVPVIQLVDVTNDALYLSVSTSAFDDLKNGSYRIALRAGSQPLAEVPLSDMSPAQIMIGQPSGATIRKLPLDLDAAVSSTKGIARNVHFFLASDLPDGSKGLSAIGFSPILCDSKRAHPDRLKDINATGVLEKLQNQILSGWAKVNDRSKIKLSVHVDGKLYALVPQTRWRKDIEGMGYYLPLSTLDFGPTEKRPQIVSVNLAGTNIPLRRSPMTVTGRHDHFYDKEKSTWK